MIRGLHGLFYSSEPEAMRAFLRDKVQLPHTDVGEGWLMQGLCVRIAKALNSMMQRKGRVFADHFFSRLLETPTEVVNAIRYVLENHTHHFGETGVDPYSSAALRGDERELVLALPRGWLLRAGWRRSKRLPATAMRVVQFGGAT
jgi:hypothetical protein